MAFLPTAWNPADIGSACTLSDSNLTATGKQANGSVRSVFGASTGKWYWEITSTGARYPIAGGARATATLTSYPGEDANGWSYYGLGARKFNGPVDASYGTTWSSPSQVIGVALDMDAGTLEFFKNGVSMGIAFTGLSGTIYAMTGGDTNSAASVTTANFGATAFAYTPPVGFNAGFGASALTLSGSVEDAAGANAARLVRAYREDTGALAGYATSNGATGIYSIGTAHTGAHTISAYPAAGENLPALTLRGVIPV